MKTDPRAAPSLLIAVLGAPERTRALMDSLSDEERKRFTRFDADAPALDANRIGLFCGSAEAADRFERDCGRNFDLRIDAHAPDAAERLGAAGRDFAEWSRLGLWGGAAGGVEMGVGSLLHATRVPLRGLALCSVQAAMMTFASASLTRPGRVLWVPLISAGLKAFSPGGGRVRPMVAISVQGAFFAGCVQALGWSPVSIALGGALMGAWAGLQGFFVQYLLLGTDLVVAYERVVRWLADTWGVTSPSLPWLLAAWALLHASAAASLAVAAWKMRAPPARVRAALEQEADSGAAPAGAPASRWRRLRREFTRWQFWLPLALVVGVLALAGRPPEALAWLALRFVTVGFLLFALLSWFQPALFASRLRRWGWWGPAAAFSRAFARHSTK